MERRVTIRDIARSLGCHHSTVSLALRDDPRLPVETRKRVREAAEKMGYRPDPMVQALAVYRTAVKPAIDHGKLAWLSNEREPQFGPNYAFRRYADGAAERAAVLGYRLEEFVLRSPGMTPRRMVQILQTRGITGILVAPQPTRRIRARIRMDWTTFSAVAIGYSLAWPPLHMVTNHQYNTAKTAFRKLTSLGCRRIGICIYRVVNERCNGGFLGGYLSERLRWPKEMQIEPYVYDRRDTKQMKAWYHENRPDAVIVHDSRDIEWMEQELKLRVPEDICMVCMGETTKGYAHISQNSHEVGVAAVDLLISMIQRNERGIPEIPRRLLIEGTWNDGYSVRRVNIPA